MLDEKNESYLDRTTTTGNVTTTMINADEYLQSLNDELALMMLPAIMFLAAILVVGFVGNIIVCYIYLAKFKVSTTRCFIVTLALFDLLTCCVGIPGELVDISQNYTYKKVKLCKALSFCNAFTNLTSVAVFVAIATDRYKKICKPLAKQMSINWAKIAVGLSCATAMLFAWPAVFVYGPRTVLTKYSDINRTDCTTDDRFIGTIYPLLYNGFLFLLFVISVSVMVVLYLHIWRTVLKSVGLHEPKAELATNTQMRQRVRYLKDSEESNDLTPAINTRHSEPITDFVTNECDGKTSTLGTKGPAVKTGKSARKQQARKTTFMLFLITLAFVLSFLPHLGLMAALGIDTVMFDSLSPGATAAYNLFLRSYFINSAFNPIIYGFCNLRFRMECKALLVKVFHTGRT
ncbi:cholecystokinin receptor type A-like [Gigantopelta aegis]|uniref:cholecystokinin receptor type A-like n=1 Tax=Gigantopelta aegis TaxID=1735272 RepID=UPI001B88E2DA|nr:cholecystokinin receptor type A-like [Gigantopelta aegis]